MLFVKRYVQIFFYFRSNIILHLLANWPLYFTDNFHRPFDIWSIVIVSGTFSILWVLLAIFLEFRLNMFELNLQICKFSFYFFDLSRFGITYCARLVLKNKKGKKLRKKGWGMTGQICNDRANVNRPKSISPEKLVKNKRSNTGQKGRIWAEKAEILSIRLLFRPFWS